MLINIQYLFRVKVEIKEAVASTVEPTVRAVYVFGSQAREDATASSDLDIGVVVDNPTGFEVFRFAAELEGRFGEEIDVAVLNDASPV